MLGSWPLRLPVVLLAVLALLVAAAPPTAWAAEKRVALVIGNGGYARVPLLANARRDADAVSALLTRLGFDVQQVNDAGIRDLRRAISAFSEKTSGAEIALVYFAGHGVEMNGINYLVPTDASLVSDFDVPDEAVPVERVIDALEGARRLRLVFLDACRENPFLRTMKRQSASRSVGRGLARTQSTPRDTLVAYAASAGAIAQDGDGQNSPFTAAIVRHLATPGLDIRLALGRVRDDVLKATGNRQEPTYYGSLGGSDIVLAAAAAAAGMPTAKGGAAASASASALEWEYVKGSASITALEGYLARHKGDAVFAALAQERLDALRQQQPPAKTPPPKASPPPAKTASIDPKPAAPDAGARGSLPEIVIGDASAPSTLIVYTSLTCPHCAKFHTSTLPKFRKTYVDTGRVRLVLREFPLDNVAAAAAMLVRCTDEKQRLPLLDRLFATQEEWAFSKGGSPAASLFKVVNAAGMAKEQFDKCLTDQKLLDDITAVREVGAKTHGITSVPAFVHTARGGRVSQKISEADFPTVFGLASAR